MARSGLPDGTVTMRKRRSPAPYWRNGLALFAFLFLLSACAPTPSPLAPTPVSSSSPFDGQWKGTGSSREGTPFTVTFTIQNNRLADILYSFRGKDGLSCSAIEYSVIPIEARPAITDETLSAPLGDDLIVSASFADGEAASGHLAIRWHDRQPRCNGDYEVDFTAAKQAAQTQSQSAPANKPNPLATFFQILVFGLSNGSILALNAIGVTIIYSAVRTLNLAHGDVFALTSALVTSLINVVGLTLDWPPLQIVGVLFLALLASAGLGALLSMGIDRLAFRPFRGHSRLAPLIATLGLSFILFQAALVWRTFQGSWIPGEHRSVPGIPEVPTDGIPNFLPEINLAAKLGIPNLVIRFGDVFALTVAILFVLIAVWFMQKTRPGRAIRALAQNHDLARMFGVNVNASIRNAFAVGGAFAGSAAFFFALYYGRPFGAHGAQSGLLAFAAAILGGIGSPVGALISALFIGVVSSLSDYYLSAQWTSVLLLALLVALLVWRPTGLASTGEAEKTALRDSIILTAPGKGSGSWRWALLVAAFGVLPLFFENSQSILRIAGIFILLALGLNIALGLAGILDFGFAVSFGLGAYAAALLAKFDASLILLVGVALGAFFGWIKGGLARRLHGDFLAVATLALGLLARQVAINLNGWTGGAGGLGGFQALHFLGVALAAPSAKFYLVFIFVLLAAWTSARLIASRTSRAWLASSEDEAAALASGVDVGRVRARALIVSSALAGLAGALYAGTLLYVDPETMSFHISAMALTMVILGGAGDVSGVILGALALVLYDKVIVGRIADLLALIWPAGLAIGSAPDIRGASFFNFGIALYLTVLLRARRK